eukprot:1415608-Rhodomonas_salina.1
MGGPRSWAAYARIVRPGIPMGYGCLKIVVICCRWLWPLDQRGFPDLESSEVTCRVPSRCGNRPGYGHHKCDELNGIVQEES